MALRYPTTAEVVTVGITGMAHDPRLRSVPAVQALPSGWTADILGVANTTLSEEALSILHAHYNASEGVAVFAAPVPKSVRPYKDAIKSRWGTVQPYREWTGDSTPSWFLLAADHGFKRYRPVPGWTSRLSEKYLPALFTLAKDEYALVYGGAI